MNACRTISNLRGELNKPYRRSPIQRRIKRAIDITAASAGLTLTAPVTLAVALAIRLNLGNPVLFRQMRPGLHGQPFELMKFRTMRTVPEHSERHSERHSEQRNGQSLDDAARLVPLGRWLRSTSLDELPTLVNVLRGDMSLVGPRPLLTAYLERYSDEQRRRHEVTPGITGLAQARGRNALSWDEKFAYDLEYVSRGNLALDMRILFETALTVLARRGVNAAGHATMPEFRGIKQGPGSSTPAS